MATEHQYSTATKLERIGWLSARDPEMKFANLMHHFNEESLATCFHELDGTKAVGPDGVSKDEYGEDLMEHNYDLLARMKRMGYRPGPVRETLIPKEGKPGGKRALGISNFQDKIFQKMMAKVLTSIYEPLFLDCSYGFRPGRGPHDAIYDLREYLFRNNVRTVIDVDLENYFGTIDHQILESFLRSKITDQKFMRYIIRMFKAGVLTAGELRTSEEGVPQGSICSPILANVMAHHVIDQWFETVVKKHCTGKVAMFRYADDMVICCDDPRDAERINVALGKRLAKFNLKMNAEKTKLIPFNKSTVGKRTSPGTLDFLGFTFYWGRSKRGFPIPKLRTSGKRMRSKLKALKEWIRKVRSCLKLRDIWKTFCAKIRGHANYYGVTFNLNGVRKFVRCALKLMFKWLNRRSQRRSFTWEKFIRYMKRYPLPDKQIHHYLVDAVQLG